jgi:hypothetical protein
MRDNVSPKVIQVLLEFNPKMVIKKAAITEMKLVI